MTTTYEPGEILEVRKGDIVLRGTVLATPPLSAERYLEVPEVGWVGWNMRDLSVLHNDGWEFTTVAKPLPTEKGVYVLRYYTTRPYAGPLYRLDVDGWHAHFQLKTEHRTPEQMREAIGDDSTLVRLVAEES
jgi:hypothetical protein